MYLICPPPPPPQKKAFCISIFFNFTWDCCNTQDKWKKGYANFFFFFFGGGKWSVLWEICKWHMQWQIQGRGLPLSPPLVLDQTEARRPEKIFFGDCPHPLFLRSCWPPPPHPAPLIWRSGSTTGMLINCAKHSIRFDPLSDTFYTPPFKFLMTILW